MTKPVTHAQKVRRIGQDSQINGTLCGRMALGNDGMNIANPGEPVTCKLCLRRLAIINKDNQP